MAATKPANKAREAPIKDRSQFKNPKTGHYTERDTENGQILNVKADKKPFKRVRKEK